MFFMRTEDKYRLQELNIEKIDIQFSLDYEVMMVPPVFVDKGTLEFSCEGLSLNTVWKVDLNEKKLFFDWLFSHILLVPNMPSEQNKLDFVLPSLAFEHFAGKAHPDCLATFCFSG